MMKILRWVAFAFLIFVLLTEVIPRIRDRVEGVSQDKIVGRPDPMAGDATACVRLAELASALVGDEVHGAKPPPGDSSGWAEASDVIHQRITEAEDVCTCPEPGCDTARDAMQELGALVNDIDQMIAGAGTGALSLTNRQERINELLEQARVEARR